MAVSRKIALKSNEQSGNQLHIYEVNPIIFYSGEADELIIELLEFNYGELIIKSLSTAILKVKALMMENEAFTIKWKQSAKGLRITLPDRLINDETRKKCTLKIKF